MRSNKKLPNNFETELLLGYIKRYKGQYIYVIIFGTVIVIQTPREKLH